MNERMLYLDSVRGLAAFIVVIDHMLGYAVDLKLAGYEISSSVGSFIEIGRMGVVMFFLTSGFVIPYSLKSGDENPIKKFFIKRFFRLYPTYWVSIFIAVVFAGYGVGVVSTGQVFMNLTMVQKFLGVDNILGSYWTLQVELVFYLLCAGLFYMGVFNLKFIGHRLSVVFLFLSLFVGVLRYFFEIKLPIAMMLGLSSMFTGAILRLYLVEKDISLRPLLMMQFILILTILPLSCYLYYQDTWVKWTTSYFLAYIFFYILCSSAKISNKYTVFLGTVSYSLYLIHPIILEVYYATIGVFIQNSLGLIPSIIIFSVPMLFISWVIYKYVERPSVDMGRWMVNFMLKNKQNLSTKV